MDEIRCDILEDGTIKIQTSAISDANHLSADELLATIDDLAGGTVQRTPREHAFWEKHRVGLHGKIQKIGA